MTVGRKVSLNESSWAVVRNAERASFRATWNGEVSYSREYRLRGGLDHIRELP
ncbi:MAG: hypothetical protein JWM91_5126 [Rhodospirillales bacterium]|nr:hypothetical protein [Rhodospirillales bacterium]